MRILKTRRSRVIFLLTFVVAVGIPIGTIRSRFAAQSSRATDRAIGWFGLSLDCPDCIDASQALRPAVITRIQPGGPADHASLKVGDTIFSVNGKQLRGPELRAALAAAETNTELTLLVAGARGTFTYKLRKAKAPTERVGVDSLPLRYRGRFADVAIDVLGADAPVVTRESDGSMLVRVAGHAVRITALAQSASTVGDRRH